MTAETIWILIVGIAVVAIMSLIGALFVQLGTKWVAKFKPSYGLAYLTTFLGNLGPFIVEFVIEPSPGMSGQSFAGGPMVLSMVINFFVAAAIYGLLIKHPDTGPIGFGKGCLVGMALT